MNFLISKGSHLHNELVTAAIRFHALFSPRNWYRWIYFVWLERRRFVIIWLNSGAFWFPNFGGVWYMLRMSVAIYCRLRTICFVAIWTFPPNVFMYGLHVHLQARNFLVNFAAVDTVFSHRRLLPVVFATSDLPCIAPIYQNQRV